MASMGLRGSGATLCLACSFPVDSERSLLGVVNRFQEMLAHVGCTIGELVMRSESGGRTRLQLDLTCSGPMAGAGDPSAEQKTLPESAAAAAAGRRSSCRMCASACSMSNCDAPCDHDAAETSPAHLERAPMVPPEPTSHEERNAAQAHLRVPESAHRASAPRPHRSLVKSSGVPVPSDARLPPDHMAMERTSQPPPNAQTGHYHHHHHHHHRHRHHEKLHPLAQNGDNALPGTVPSHVAATVPSSPSPATGTNTRLGDDSQLCYTAKHALGETESRTPANGEIQHPRKRRRRRDVKGAGSGSEAPHGSRRVAITVDETADDAHQTDGAHLPEPSKADGTQKSSSHSTAFANAPVGRHVGRHAHAVLVRKDREAESNRNDIEAREDHSGPDMQTCIACEEVFQNDLDAQRHQFTAHPAPPVKNVDGRVECPVPECHQDFAREHVMRRHIQSVHLHIREFPCNSCDRVFADQSTLNQHVTAVHLKRKPWTCSVCGANFTQSSSLGKHRRRFHVDAQQGGTSGAEEPGGTAMRDSRESDCEDRSMNDP